MDIAPTGIRYQNYHKMIKAIEKCSLQAMFGPEITSTRQLLPKASEISPVFTFKASIDNVNDSLSASSNRVSSLSDEIHISVDPLLINPTNEDGNIPSEPTANDGGLAVILNNEEGNAPTEESVNGGDTDPISAREDGMTTLQQSEILGRIPMETWGQKVEEIRQWSGTRRILRDIHDLSYSNHKHPNHKRLWDSKNLFCIGCTEYTMEKCETCERRCCLWSACKEIADEPKVGTLPQERVQATQWLEKIASLMTYGIDERTFMACSRCMKVLCPKCTSICEICDALSCPDCCGQCPICRISKCVRCKPNWEDACSYHNGPPAI